MTWSADIKTFFIDRGTSASFKCMWILLLTTFFFSYVYLYNPTVRRLEALPGGGGGSHVACLNFKTSRVSVYKCLSLIVSFTVNVVIGQGRLSLVAISFYALSLLFGPCRLSEFTLAGPQVSLNSPGEKNQTYLILERVHLHIKYILLGMLSWVLRLWAWSARHAGGRKRVKKMPGHVLFLPKNQWVNISFYCWFGQATNTL